MRTVDAVQRSVESAYRRGPWSDSLATIYVPDNMPEAQDVHLRCMFGSFSTAGEHPPRYGNHHLVPSQVSHIEECECEKEAEAAGA